MGAEEFCKKLNRTSFLPERVRMMQAWSDYLDALSEGRANVLTLRHGCKA